MSGFAFGVPNVQFCKCNRIRILREFGGDSSGLVPVEIFTRLVKFTQSNVLRCLGKIWQ